ncbi:bifunctional UDP-2,4-diacetamido-2,4,6-trideoxy-beta-L-altropyranose hydrolase/GNAT family N-acetyltransferase [Globicatella sulfidifaciens]|uniref:UDP-2,4-diacetamido-2,4, 6-trideoxy-beta-L-altropyranose hydrolase n=1 Tax=Globicatella sulfidifaciens TaxID=136093 RepID=A0A7X8C2E9_9LACT|nr:bifunctional UDP-2,4-diacetamido-2,4,6-trideoxy-beta-L-altropyranose hydrolase/GNAT family N-acetyltransferase [Globicatella sulfidifaciens]NLJ17762.1 UDP-2,4-diacetamido-2,4,6-trideoxy-beta-L-altropyranose hydrolase [Globicatella sulfidifaciens]
MKIKIFTEGGKNIGYGHLSRCIALYDEIQNRRNEVELIIQGDLEDIGLLKNKDFRNENWISIEYLNKTLTNEDYVIVDSYKAQKEHYEKISSKSRKALYIDDIGRLQYPKGIIVNPALDTGVIDYSYSTNERALTGSKYVILRSSFSGIERSIIRDTVGKVLVVMGGTDVRDITTSIIENICDQNQDIIFDIVINATQYERISSVNKLKNINYYMNLSAKEMCQIMLSSDLAISAAGQTIYELIATQTPFIAVQVAENQQNNVDSLMEHISSQIVLRYDENNFIDKLKEKFLEVITYDYRKRITKEMKGIIDGYGITRIVDALLNDSNKKNEIYLRKVHIKDLKDVFELSNKDYVRQYSINKDKILWDDHVKWFNNVLKDSNIVFYVVTDERNAFLGQIRYKLEKDSAIVSISLSDKLRGKGLSRMILDQSIEKLFEENLNVNEIIAYVSESNVASMKIFKDLKFKDIDADDSMIKLLLERSEYNVN